MGLIMKKQNILIILVLTFTLISCDQNTRTTSGSSGTDATTQTTGGDDDGTTTGYTGTGATCSGSPSGDGQGPGTPIHHMNLFLAGYQNWFPQVNADPLAQQTFITPQEAGILFSTDSRLRVRFKVNSQPQAPSNETYCYGRNTGVQIIHYQKLKFEIYLRDVRCSTGSTTSCPSNTYVLGPRYAGPIMIGPVDVNGCSDVIDLGHLRNQTNFGTTIEVAAVKSDQYCQTNGSFCEAEKNVRSIDCWSMTLQVVTDSTQDFN